MGYAIETLRLRDADGRQVHRVRLTGTSIAAGTVAEITVAAHIAPVCVLQRVNAYNATGGSMTNRQPDITQGPTGQTSVAASYPVHYQATSTAKATDISDTGLRLVLAIPETESLYYRMVPDGGSDNAETVDLYFLDVTAGQ